MELLKNKIFHLFEQAHQEFHHTETVGIAVASYGSVTNHPLAWGYMGAVVVDKAGHLVNDALHKAHLETQENQAEMAGKQELESKIEQKAEVGKRQTEEEKPQQQWGNPPEH